MILEHVNELSVFVASVISVAVGSIWYSPLLFGKPWMQAAGLTIEDEELSTKEAVVLTAKAVLTQVVFFYVIAQLIAVSAKLDALTLPTLGVALALFLVSYMVSVVIWERRSLTYLSIHAGYSALALSIGISIIVYWPW